MKRTEQSIIFCLWQNIYEYKDGILLNDNQNSIVNNINNIICILQIPQSSSIDKDNNHRNVVIIGSCVHHTCLIDVFGVPNVQNTKKLKKHVRHDTYIISYCYWGTEFIVNTYFYANVILLI